jgi:putative endonuclease
MAPDTRPWWVYIVECAKGGYYTGIARDVDARVARHNAGRGSKAVKALGLPVTLRATFMVGPKSCALYMEALIKRMTHKEKAVLVSMSGKD